MAQHFLLSAAARSLSLAKVMRLREAMAASMRGLRIGGEGRAVEIDGAYFGGHVRPENRAADRVDRRLAENRSGKRCVVVAACCMDPGTGRIRPNPVWDQAVRT